MFYPCLQAGDVPRWGDFKFVQGKKVFPVEVKEVIQKDTMGKVKGEKRPRVTTTEMLEQLSEERFSVCVKFMATARKVWICTSHILTKSKPNLKATSEHEAVKPKARQQRGKGVHLKESCLRVHCGEGPGTRRMMRCRM